MTKHFANKMNTILRIFYCSVGYLLEPLKLNVHYRYSGDSMYLITVLLVTLMNCLSLPRMSKWGGGAKCPKCSKTVYMAEEVLAEGHKWHKLCFKCSQCGKMLDRYEIHCSSCPSSSPSSLPCLSPPTV